MIEVVLSGLLINVLKFIITGAAVWYSLRWLDKSIKVKFSETYAIIRSDPNALAFYHGMRVIAAALLFGAIAG